VARTITIKIYESEAAGDGARQYEFVIDGQFAGAGMAPDLQDALLSAIEVAAGQADEVPDN
jgi:hypothetical protein